MNIVFMGTPDFAVPSLEALIKEGYNILCVVTQPDKPKGRGNKMSFSEVKEKALEYNIKVMQPKRIKNDIEFYNELKKFNIDIIVVVAFGQILPSNILKLPRYGCINVHASLLPKLRGAAPINWSIINGDTKTGITTMFMDEGLDTGDMLISQEVEIDKDENAGELHDKLKNVGANLLIETIKLIEKEEIDKTPQKNEFSTYAPMLNKDTGLINWNETSQKIKNLVRGTNPKPGAYSNLIGQKIKIWSVEIDSNFIYDNIDNSNKTGEIYNVNKDGIFVYTKDGGIIIKELQTEGKGKTTAYSYTLGHKIDIGSKFI